MRKVMIITILFTYVFILFVANVDAFDPEAALQVSKGIAEWRLMNKDKNETQVEPTVYVSSSLGGMVEKGDSKGIGVVSGLTAFDNDYWIESQIRKWELNESVRMSGKYISRLPSNPSVGVAGDITTKAEGMAYQLCNPPPMTSVTYNVASTAMGAAITGIETINRIGTSIQIMNPPIYLQNNPKFTASQRILGIPVSGTWEGSGSYLIQGGRVNFQETLITAGPDITRIHTDWGKTNLGSYYRHVEISTPVTNPIERFMMTHYPVGGYWDPATSTITTTTRIQQSYRIETYGGMPRVTPLPNSAIGTWGSGRIGNNWYNPSPSLNSTWKTVQIGSTTYRYPSIDWTSIPKTNWTIPSTISSPTYISPISKIPTYTPPRIPSSLGRRYWR